MDNQEEKQLINKRINQHKNIVRLKGQSDEDQMSSNSATELERLIRKKKLRQLKPDFTLEGFMSASEGDETLVDSLKAISL